MLRAVRNLVVPIGFMLLAPAVGAGQIELLSRAGDVSDTATGLGFMYARKPAVSADGRWVAFTSTAVNLAAGPIDRNRAPDVVLHDRQTGKTVLASHAAGLPATAGTVVLWGSGTYDEPLSISDDGRWLVYETSADDLVPGQVPSLWPQVFLYDRETGANTLVSRSYHNPAAGGSSISSTPRVSGDGNWVVFQSGAVDLFPGQSGGGIFLYERATGQILLASPAAGSSTTSANGFADHPVVSRDGRYVAFRSGATDLVPGYTRDPNSTWGTDAFLFDRVTGATTLVSRTRNSATTGGGGWYPEISPDGAAVAFPSTGTNLVPGQFDHAGSWDLFLFDRAAGTTVLVSHAPGSFATATGANEQPGTFQVTPGGAWVVFLDWDAQFRSQVRLFRRSNASVTLVSRSISSPALGANQSSQEARVTADGAFVVFDSAATDLVYGQSGTGVSNVYLFGRAADALTLVSGSGGSGLVSGNHYSLTPEVSADGSVIAYSTFATDLVPGTVDRNGIVDVALYDRGTAATTLASLHAPGQASATPSAASTLLSASADGRHAVFLSASINAMPGLVDRSDGNDVFLTDRVTGTTTLVSHADGLPATTGDGESVAAAISADGAWVAFVSRSTDLVPGQEDTNIDSWYSNDEPGFDVFLYNRATGAATLASHIPGSSTTAGDETCIPELSISADGRYVAFVGLASNLVSGQVDNYTEDIFLYDRVADTTTLVSRKSGTANQTANQSSIEPVISGDGRWIAFHSLASDLVAGSTDTNNLYDVFLFDRDSGQALLLSRAAGTAATAANGLSTTPSLSPDGRYVVFTSNAGNLVPGQTGPANSNLFLFDRATGVVELISRRAGTATTTVEGAGYGAVSDDGRYVAFLSTGSLLVPGQSAGLGTAKANIFVHDRVTRQTELISRSVLSPLKTSDNHADRPTLSPDGRYVAFVSRATDLAPGATGRDVYLADRQLHTLERVAEGPGPYYDLSWTGPYAIPRLSADGRAVLFTSGGLSLVPGDWNGANDVFAWVPAPPSTGDFFTLSPCRLIDTRQAGQGPALVNGVPAVVDVHGVCGVPSTARAVAVNVTVLEAQGPGRLTLHPGNLSTPNTSTINFQPGQTLANNALLALASNGEGTLGILPVVTGGGTVHVIVDVSGWFE
jgi:Tol biopolymer transport system component